MEKDFIYDVVILGAGASGLMCATWMSKDLKVLLIDANSSIGAKIRISGGGKCNVVNDSITSDDFLGDKEFLEPLFQSIAYRDILNFFNDIEFKKRKKGQYFCNNSATQITNFFAKSTMHCDFELNKTVLFVKKEKNIFSLVCENKIYKSKMLVVASGGVSYPKLGASGIGYEIAKSFGHGVEKISPALVGFTVQKEEFWVKKLSGISLHANLQVGNKKFDDDLLFSHKGFSGPAVLNASLFWQKGSITIDFMPQNRLKSLLKKESKKQLSSILPLPKRFIKEFLQAINLQDKSICNLTSDEVEILHKKIHTYTFSPAGTFGYAKAEVTKGGVSTTEINPLTYESKKVQNLFFIGEVLDITGRLGGYNFYFAFGSAMMMGRNFEYKKLQ